MQSISTIILVIFAGAVLGCVNDVELRAVTSPADYCLKESETIQLDKKLGAGSYAEVFVLKEDPSQVVKVMKFGKEEEGKMPAVIREINANSCLSQEKAGFESSEYMALKFRQACRFSFNKFTGYTVMFFYPRMEGGTLEAFMRSGSKILKSPEWLAGTMQHLLRALRRIHQAGLIHRDIKPANIMFPSKDPVYPRFIDFGFAAHTEKSLETLGTPEYTAPEILSILYSDPKSKKAAGPMSLPFYTNKVDVFSLGLIFFELVTGAKLKKDRDGIYTTPSFPADMDENFKILITSMLKMKPADRPDVFEAYQLSKKLTAKILV